MAYSTAYQTVIAGRVREDELGFFKFNKVAYPTGSKYIVSVGGKMQPTIDNDFLGTEFVGKNINRTVGLLSAYNPNKYNAGE